MTEFNLTSGKLNVGGLFSKAIETFRSKLQFFVFTGLLIGIGNLRVAVPGLETGDVNTVGIANISMSLPTISLTLILFSCVYRLSILSN